MANFGRFVCVLLPFLLTLASLIALLVAGLAGIADKSLYMFEVNTTKLSISPLSVSKILHDTGVQAPSLPGIGSRQTGSQTKNITAADLGLYDLYDVGIWGYCYTAQNGTRDCTQPAFDWASHALNMTTGNINSMITATGLNVTLPKEITDAVQLFGTVSKWTQVVFIIAYVALGVELLFGLFAGFSRAFSCITWLVALVAAVAVGGAAGLATATSVVVVGAIEGTAKFYGVDGHFNQRFLAALWIAAAFAIGAALFWLFTICCCAPDHHHSAARRGRGPEEKYQRLGEPTGYPGYAQYPRENPQHAGAYEPYSHARV